MLLNRPVPFVIPEQTLALTYDDGPGPDTVEIATFLNSRNIRAAFFVLGQHARQSPEIVRAVKNLGHLIANHTTTHPRLTTLAAPQVVHEVEQTDALLHDLIAPGPFLLRPPYGDWSPEVAAALNSLPALAKYQGPVSWDIAGGDWQIGQTPDGAAAPITVADCERKYLKEIHAKRRGVVLLHDRLSPAAPPGASLDLTHRLIHQLKDFTFVALDEISIAQHAPE